MAAKVDQEKCTGCGIFAAGDLRATIYRQIATAMGDGVTAALSCEKYISRIRGTEFV